jgi:hypothetical protein
MVIFWVVMPCSLIDAYERYREQVVSSEDGAGKFLRNVGAQLQIHVQSHNPEDDHGHLHRRENLICFL